MGFRDDMAATASLHGSAGVLLLHVAVLGAVVQSSTNNVPRRVRVGPGSVLAYSSLGPLERQVEPATAKKHKILHHVKCYRTIDETYIFAPSLYVLYFLPVADSSSL